MATAPDTSVYENKLVGELNLSITHKCFVKLCYTHGLTATQLEHLHRYRITQ
jgi:hypothetical protein